MSEKQRPLPMDCGQAREICHRILDGDLMDAHVLQSYEAHLRGCDSCRDADRELRAVSNALHGLAPDAFPDAALRQVWKQTSRRRASGSSRSAWRFDWRAAAAAAIVIGASVGLWRWSLPPAGPSEEELARATEQTRLVLGLTAEALRSTERAVLQRVLVDEVSPALRRLPLAWSGETETVQPPKTGDGV